MTWVSKVNLMSVEAVSKNKFDFKHDGLIVMPSGQTMASNGVLTVLVDKMAGMKTDGGLKSPVKLMPDAVKGMMKEANPVIRLADLTFNSMTYENDGGQFEARMEKIAWEIESMPEVKGARPFCQVDFDLIETAVKLLSKMTKGNKRLGMMGLTIGNEALELTAYVEETNQAVIAQVKAFDVRERVASVRRLKGGS